MTIKDRTGVGHLHQNGDQQEYRAEDEQRKSSRCHIEAAFCDAPDRETDIEIFGAAECLFSRLGRGLHRENSIYVLRLVGARRRVFPSKGDNKSVFGI